jgi:putative transposase
MTGKKVKSGTIDVRALLAGDEEFLRALVRSTLDEVLEAEMTETLGAEKGERTRAAGLPVGLLRPNADHAGRRIGAAGCRRIGAGGSRPSCSNGISVRSGRWWRRWRRCTCKGFRPAKACPRESGGEGDHRGVVRPQLFGVVDQCDEPATGRGSGAICRPPVGQSLSLCDPRRALRKSGRERRHHQPGSADRDRHRLGRPASGAGQSSSPNRESRSSWRDFLLALKARGLHDVEFVVADDHAGLRAALREVLAEAAYQRCYVHFLRNALDHVPRKVDDDCLQELRWLYDRRDLSEARRDLAAWLAKWSGKYSKLTGWVEDNIDETLTFYRLPRQHHKHLKSTNMLERLNEEIRRRTQVVRIFPNGDSCLRLVRALAIETHENWLEQHRYLNMDDLREHKKKALRRAA